MALKSPIGKDAVNPITGCTSECAVKKTAARSTSVSTPSIKRMRPIQQDFFLKHTIAREYFARTRRLVELN
jgi:hypothetical protein